MHKNEKKVPDFKLVRLVSPVMKGSKNKQIFPSQWLGKICYTLCQIIILGYNFIKEVFKFSFLVNIEGQNKTTIFSLYKKLEYNSGLFTNDSDNNK